MTVSAKHLPLAGRLILLVENEPVIAQAIADCLQDAGASVLTAGRTDNALRIAKRPDISAAVLDLDLGDSDSIMVCRHLSERGVPFLFYSGYDEGYIRTKWPNATVVMKPAGEQVLITALLDLIEP
jgi:DNA-binding response OmpR family regulator